jgi:hypothetical protein
LPHHEKSIPPKEVGGIAGGPKYVIFTFSSLSNFFLRYIAQNIYFKFAVDNNNLFDGDENARKLAGITPYQKSIFYLFSSEIFEFYSKYENFAMLFPRRNIFLHLFLGHEMKALTQLFNCGVDELNTNMMVIVDYRGFRLTAQSLLPIGKETLVNIEISAKFL